VPLLARSGELPGVPTAHFPASQAVDERSRRMVEMLARQGADTIERMRIDAKPSDAEELIAALS